MSVARGFPNAGHYYSNLVKPIELDVSFRVDPTNLNGLGVSAVKSNGYVRNVFMHTTSTPGTNNGYLNPNPAVGFALIQFTQNFNSYIDGFSGWISPTTGAPLAISGTLLTVGNPYIISSVGTVPAPSFTITALADVGGSLAGKFLTITDGFSNNYVLYFQVSGVGTPPALVGPLAGYIAVPVAFLANSSAVVVAGNISTVINGINGGNSFSSTSAGAVITVVSARNFAIPLPLGPNAQTSGFTVSSILYTTLQQDWNHVGLFPGLTPTPGQSFIATTTGGAIGTGTVVVPGISGISSMEIVGDPNTEVNNQSIATFGGAWVMVQFLASTSAAVTTLIPTAPNIGSVAKMSFKLDGSQVTIDGL
jgi:hypothetical protein